MSVSFKDGSSNEQRPEVRRADQSMSLDAQVVARGLFPKVDRRCSCARKEPPTSALGRYCSLMSQGTAGRVLSGCAMPWEHRSLRARWHSMGCRVWGGLVANRSRPIKSTACDRIDAIAHSLPGGTPLGSLSRPLSLRSDCLTRWVTNGRRRDVCTESGFHSSADFRWAPGDRPKSATRRHRALYSKAKTRAPSRYSY